MSAVLEAANSMTLSHTDDGPFEDLDVDVAALERPALENYAIELKGECKFLRAAWHAACRREHAATVAAEHQQAEECREALQAHTKRYWPGIAAALKAESQVRVVTSDNVPQTPEYLS
jgi:hypothetical protein